MLIKQCGRCNAKISYPLKYCEVCEEKVEQEQEEGRLKSQRRYNQSRDKKYLRFYKSVEWRMVSQSCLQSVEYRCEHCSNIATNVHHIKPIQTELGWELRLDFNNLKAIMCYMSQQRAWKVH